MIKIIRALCKYFLPGSKKMSLSSKVKQLRDELLQNCKYAIDHLEASKQYVTRGYQNFGNQSDIASSKTSTPDASAFTTSDILTPEETNIEITDTEVVHSFMILTHGVLIQEWEHFLYDIYAEGFVYYLNLGSPKYHLRLRELNPKMEVADMRQHICEEVKNSFRSLKELFARSRSFFNVEEPKLFREMQKQIQIRHIFQHSKGEIRSSDLEDIGRKSFDILNDKGTVMSYGEGEDIPLSLPEIRKLDTVIEEYSEAFQKQAESAKPITPTLSH